MASHTVLKEQLLEMGFDENLINGALHLLKDNATLESVIESIDDGSAETALKNLNEETDNETSKTPNEKTSEDIEAKKKNYADKIKQRRLEIEEKEKEADKLREIQRRKDGKDMGKLRDELKKMQQENYIQNLKREKAENKAAREQILRQIEQDKEERKARFSKECPTTTSTTPLVITSTASKTGKTKLAIRLLDGSQIIQEFDNKEVLSAVRAYIVTQKNIPFNITFAMSPRPAFTEEDMEKSLLVLGLSPNARLQVIKRS